MSYDEVKLKLEVIRRLIDTFKMVITDLIKELDTPCVFTFLAFITGILRNNYKDRQIANKQTAFPLLCRKWLVYDPPT